MCQHFLRHKTHRIWCPHISSSRQPDSQGCESSMSACVCLFMCGVCVHVCVELSSVCSLAAFLHLRSSPDLSVLVIHFCRRCCCFGRLLCSFILFFSVVILCLCICRRPDCDYRFLHFKLWGLDFKNYRDYCS